MPLRRWKAKKREEASMPSGEDFLGALPDAVLHHVLSFLPSYEAVRTCVLSRRWRDLWKSTPALRIRDTEDKWKNAENMNEFVNHLLLLRDRSPLDICEINSYPDYTMGDNADKPLRYIDLWIRCALSLKARVLHVLIYAENEWLMLDAPLVSQHLTVLELQNVMVKHALDFSSCPVLKALKMNECNIMAHEISSQSLRHLIANDNIFAWHSRTRISIPSLVSLQLHGFFGKDSSASTHAIASDSIDRS